MIELKCVKCNDYFQVAMPCNFSQTCPRYSHAKAIRSMTFIGDSRKFAEQLEIVRLKANQVLELLEPNPDKGTR